MLLHQGVAVSKPTGGGTGTSRHVLQGTGEHIITEYDTYNTSISENLLGYLQCARAGGGCGVKRSPTSALAIAEQVSKTFSHHFAA